MYSNGCHNVCFIAIRDRNNFKRIVLQYLTEITLRESFYYRITIENKNHKSYSGSENNIDNPVMIATRHGNILSFFRKGEGDRSNLVPR